MASSNDAKKILFCTLSSDEYSKSRHELIKLFINNKFEICLVSPDDYEYRRYFNYEFLSYRKVPICRNGTNLVNDLISYKNLKKVIDDFSPDIVYSFSGAKAVIFTSLAAGHINKRNLKIFCMINGLGSVYHNFSLYYYGLRVLMNLLYKVSLKDVHRVFFQNNDDLATFIKHRIVKRTRCSIINGAGVNLELFPFTALPDDKVCLFAGRLLRDKGIYEFVKTAEIVKKSIQDVKFIIVGEFDSNPMSICKNEMDNWIADGIVEYWGRQDDMYRMYSLCQIFILPSYHEGTPRTVLEALSVGRPVITTNAPGCSETVIDGENGYLVPVGSYNELAEKVIYLINNKELISSMSIKSRLLAENKYDVNKINDELIKLILAED